jgi:hypothetical protein
LAWFFGLAQFSPVWLGFLVLAQFFAGLALFFSI